MPEQSRAMTMTGRVLRALVIAFLLLDAGMKLAALPVVLETSAQIGWPADAGTARMLGALLIVPVLLFALPRTAPLGALLLTAYLGGACATHVRIGSPLFSHSLFAVYVGIMMWAGLWLCDARLRALLPVATPSAPKP
jgi:hypothetical protein